MSADITDTWGIDPAPVRTEVAVGDIVVRPEWQVRDSFDRKLMYDYATRYAYGEDMPPIQLARVNGALILMDGAHRLAAQVVMKRETVDATVTDLSEDEARWRAAMANTKHGAQLTKQSEKWRIVKLYIAQGRHRKGRGVKSYRDWCKDMEGLVAKSALHRWLTKHHPKIAARMANPKGGPLPEAAPPRPPSPYERVAGNLEEAAKKAVAEARGMCPTARKALAAGLQRAAQAIAEALPWAPPSSEQVSGEPGDF